MSKGKRSRFWDNPEVPSLIRNDAAVADPVAMQHVSFSINIEKGVRIRKDTMEGREYTVVPMVMLTQGVHEGSQGPLLYLEEELSKVTEIWNFKPVVVYHPEINGEGVSACDPIIATNQKVGIIMNTRWDANYKVNGKKVGGLRAEAWLEDERVSSVDERVATAITNHQMLELSTGLFSDNEDKQGKFGDKEYTAIARNFRPDHLAILPDRIGACSIADGAGFIRNQITSHGIRPKDRQVVCNVVQQTLQAMGLQSLVDNELSHDAIRRGLYAALRVRFPEDPAKPVAGPWIEVVFDTFFIYEMGGTLFRLGYSVVDEEVELNAKEPVKVERHVEYRTVSGSVVANGSGAIRNKAPTNNEENPMDKKQVVEGLIKNHGWKESDREFLMGQSEDRLALMTPKAPPVKNEGTSNAPAETAPDKQAASVPPAPATVDQYIANAPAEMQGFLRNSVGTYNQKRAELVAKIVANKRNRFSEDQLRAKDLAELEALAELAAEPVQNENTEPVPHYFGMMPAMAGNASGSADDEPLALPDWSGKSN